MFRRPIRYSYYVSSLTVHRLKCSRLKYVKWQSRKCCCWAMLSRLLYVIFPSILFITNKLTGYSDWADAQGNRPECAQAGSLPNPCESKGKMHMLIQHCKDSNRVYQNKDSYSQDGEFRKSCQQIWSHCFEKIPVESPEYRKDDKS